MAPLSAFPSLSDLILTQADRFGDQEAMISEGRRWTYQALLTGIRKAALLFSQGGVVAGERVLLMAPTCDTFVVSFFALAWLGALPVPVHPHLLEVEVIALARASQARLMLADASIGDPVRAAFLRACEGSVIRMDPRRFQISWQTLEAEATPIHYYDLPYEEAPDPVSASPGTLATLLFAPTPSGKPRGIRLTHGNLLEIAAAVTRTQPLADHPSTAITLPLHHAYPLVGQLLATFAVGGAVHLFRNLAFPFPVLQAIQQERVQSYAGMPATFRRLASLEGLEELDLSRVRLVTCAGGPMDPGDPACIRKVFPRAIIHHAYGLAAAGGRVTSLSENDPRFSRGAAGCPLPGVEIRIVHQGVELPGGRAGEIQVRGPGIMAGYWQEDLATETAFEGAWLRTPDRGHLDDQGCLFVAARRDAMLIVGEEKVAPPEVEEVLRRHRSVQEAAVLGLPDPLLGEKVVACVTPAVGGVDREGLMRHCDRHLARHKCPQEVQVFERFPRLSDGEVDRVQLRAWCQETASS